jgi:hypothetical protein
MGLDCSNCGGLLCTSGVRASLGIEWFCAWCGQAGTYCAAVSTLGRKVRARVVTVAGDASLHKPWAPAESVPYAERVAVEGRDGR